MTPIERAKMLRLVTSPEFERGYDRGRKIRSWVHENKTGLTLGAIALAATAIWIYRQRHTSPHFSVSGVWTELAKKLGMEIGADLSIKEAQQYLNIINAKKSPNQGGAGLVEDGILGTNTGNAIRAFQAGNGLEQTGVIDDETGNALLYFVAAVSKSPIARKMATVTPKTFATITPPTKKRKPILNPLGAGGFQAVDIGQGWVTYGNCACKWDDTACAARCGGVQPSSPPPSMFESALRSFDSRSTGDVAANGDYRTGIQSTSMYDPQNYYTDSFGAWVLPMAPECWWDPDSCWEF